MKDHGKRATKSNFDSYYQLASYTIKAEEVAIVDKKLPIY